jgi:hypothetical protein
MGLIKDEEEKKSQIFYVFGSFTYKSFTEIMPKMNDYGLKCAKKAGPFLTLPSVC